MNANLKAYVRIDGQNRVVAGSLIYRKNMPKVGKWREIDVNTCCTTTTVAPTTTTTTTVG